MNIFFTNQEKSWHDPKEEKILFDIQTDDVPQIGTEFTFKNTGYQVVNVNRTYKVDSIKDETPQASILIIEVECVRKTHGRQIQEEKSIEKVKTVTCHVEIGKSKKLVTISFTSDRFISVENNQLFLKEENRKLKITDEQIKNLLFQLNDI
ncbi:hypothetical protein [Flavobacterium sp. HNIBRBA15423]|uniref:hypothetical protein n=1 Tax=Flavobacterium sp. HNIBRBA15423 TaxID=3458683 RepID=UPI004043CDDD